MLVTRDPSKRRIKPNESILAYNPDIEDDSESDDSDYNPVHLDDEDIELDSEGENKDDADHSKSEQVKKGKKNGKSETNGQQDGSSGDDSDDSDDSSDESDEDEEEVENLELDDFDQAGLDCVTNNTLAKSELLLSNSSHLTTTINGPTSAANTELGAKIDPEEAQKTRLKKILVCCVCLSDVSRNDDEIVECDSCGTMVHELCYGITIDDAESIHSDASSASTEPWFCDPCKAGVKSPASFKILIIAFYSKLLLCQQLCELCPNAGGIYKITSSGRWVHMVCALYTHGISFADTERLRGPVLADIPFNRWGSKACSLCEDERYSLTGVAASCDAGMCKTFFHVTCAQREGLLCAHLDEVDPYIVYCKLHSDRHSAKLRRRNYLALVAKNRMLARTRQNSNSIEDGITNQRTLSKLYSQRKKFIKNYQELGHGSDGERIPLLRT